MQLVLEVESDFAGLALIDGCAEVQDYHAVEHGVKKEAGLMDGKDYGVAFVR